MRNRPLLRTSYNQELALLDTTSKKVAVGILLALGAALPWLGGNISVVTPYVVMFLVLLVRPYGLFGTREVERV